MNFIRKHIASFIVLLLVIVLSVASFFIDIEPFRDSIESAGIFAPILYILIKSSTVIFAPLSGTALYILSVPVFGFWYGLLYSFLGDLLGSIVAFYISRFFGRPVVKYFVGKKHMVYVENSLEFMSTLKGFFILRLGLLAMPEVAAYAAGLTKIKFLPFIIIHMGIDLFPIIILTSPGLFIESSLPVGVIISVMVIAVAVTLINLFIFGRIIHKRVKQKELLSSPHSSN